MILFLLLYIAFWGFLVLIVGGTVLVMNTLNDLHEKISSLEHQLEMATYRIGVLERVQDKRN